MCRSGLEPSSLQSNWAFIFGPGVCYLVSYTRRDSGLSGSKPHKAFKRNPCPPLHSSCQPGHWSCGGDFSPACMSPTRHLFFLKHANLMFIGRTIRGTVRDYFPDWSLGQPYRLREQQRHLCDWARRSHFSPRSFQIPQSFCRLLGNIFCSLMNSESRPPRASQGHFRAPRRLSNRRVRHKAHGWHTPSENALTLGKPEELLSLPLKFGRETPLFVPGNWRNRSSRESGGRIPLWCTDFKVHLRSSPPGAAATNTNQLQTQNWKGKSGRA